MSEELNLAELTKEASKQLLEERKASTISSIKKIYQKYDGLLRQIKKQENELTKSKKSLQKVEHKLLELDKGNWNVLNEQDSKQDSQDKSQD